MTLNIEKFERHKRPLVEAILSYGNVNRFALAMGLNRQTVDGWLYRCKYAPPIKYCRLIEEVTMGAFPREKLRPDLFEKTDKQILSIDQKIDGCLRNLKELMGDISALKKNKKRRK